MTPRTRFPRVLRLAVLAACLGATAKSLVTADNLLEQEQLWPYRVALTQSWQPPGSDQALPAGDNGVLIRVEPGGVARIDFARDGKYEVPIDKTDLVENANKIQRGELAKPAPNFLYAIATRLLDSKSDPLAPLQPDEIAHQRRFLCVFADPRAEGFAAMADALKPLAQRTDVATILFPQGDVPSPEVRERLRAREWLVPFLFEHLSEPYTKTLVREGTPFPTVMLVTDEGRVLYQDLWQPGALAKLQQALASGSSH